MPRGAPEVSAAVWVGGFGAERAAGSAGGATGGGGGGATAGAAAGADWAGALALGLAAIFGAAGGGAGTGGALTVRGAAGTDGAFGTIGGLAAIFGGAGGVARGATGLRTDRAGAAFAGAGRAAVARFIRDGGFNWIPPDKGAVAARGVAGDAGAKREPL